MLAQKRCIALLYSLELYSRVSLFSFEGSQHAVHAEDDKRDGEYLTHIDGQRCLEGFLYLLGVLDEETEGEDIRQTEAEIPARTYLLGHTLVEREVSEIVLAKASGKPSGDCK